MKIISKRLSVILFFLLYHFILYSQDNRYIISEIPDSLLKNADVVIREGELEIILEDIENAIFSVKEIKAILNKSGSNHANLYIPYYKGRTEVVSITGKIYDKNGKLLDIIDKKDIEDRSLYDGFSLYTDARYKVVRAPLTDYPYTVEYSYTVKEKGGYINFPRWRPLNDYRQSVENYVFRIYSKNLDAIRYYTQNSGESLKYEVDHTNHFVEWTLLSIKAIEEEEFGRMQDRFLTVLSAPKEVEFEGYAGDFSTWEDYGKWIYALIQGREKLPEETVNEVKELVKEVEGNYNKAKLIYNYMQKKTRYVNIALGIGGWQPAMASETDYNKYGDCKALSLYMKSLLSVVDIPSCYTLIYAGKNREHIYKDFPSNQFNHVILCVPIESDTIWLECTSQDQSFGYLGMFTDDRDALMIDSDGKGKLVRTPKYSALDNVQIFSGVVDINDAGDAKIQINKSYSGVFYEALSNLIRMDDDERKKAILKSLSIPNIVIKSISIEDNKDRIPNIVNCMELEALRYASVSANRLFLVPNIMNRLDYIPKECKDRQSDIHIERGETQIDSIKYNIPEIFEIEYLPENIFVENEFGKFEVRYDFKGSELIYIRKFIIEDGSYPKAQYEELRIFLKNIYQSDKQKVVFKRKNS